MPSVPSRLLKAAFVFVILTYAVVLADNVVGQIIQWHVHTLMPPPTKKVYDDMADHSSDDYYAVREASLYGMAVGIPLLIVMAACAAISATFLGTALVQSRAAVASAWFWATALPLIVFLVWFISRLVRIFVR